MAHLVLNKMGKAFLDDDTAVREQKPATKKIQIIKEVEKSLNMQVTPLFFQITTAVRVQVVSDPVLVPLVIVRR